MPTIVFASSKGGVGKTTAATVLASELARQGEEKGISISLIDVDPNQHSAKWAKKPGCPPNIKLVENSNEESIIDDIDNAEEISDFVIVDLEGTASMAVASAISRADLVITMCQASQDDADEAVKTIKLIKRQSKVLKRDIAFSVLFSRTSSAIKTKMFNYILDEFNRIGVDVFETSLIEREAFRTVRSFGGIVNDLNPREFSGVENASANAFAFASEVKKKLVSLMEVA